MAFPLQHIEQQFPGELVDLGRSLYEKEAVGSLVEAYKHLWTGIVTDNQQFEVEIQISPSKVKAYTCDCADFRKDHICKHIVAFLFSLRQKIVIEKLKKASKQQHFPKKRSPQKLSVNAVLQYASEQNLKDFIRTYARVNRPFALALKAHFAIDVPMEDSTNKYVELINTTVRSTTLTKKGFSPTGKKRISWLIDQLESHWETAFGQKNYRESLSIIIAAFDHLFPLRQKEIEDEKSIRLLKRLSIYFAWLETLMTSDMGPQLRKELNNHLEKKVQLSGWLLIALEDATLERILQQAPDPVKLNFLTGLQAVFLQINCNSLPGQQLLLLALKLQPQFTLPGFILELLHTAALLDDLLHELALPEDSTIQKQLALIGLSIQAEPDFHWHMKSYLLEVALLENDRELIIDLSRALFLATGDIRYYKELKQQLSEEDNLLKNTLQQLEEFPPEIDRRKIRVQLYLFEEQWDQLFQILQELQDLDLLMQIDQQIPASIRPQLETIYEVALRSYLASYLGQPAAHKVSRLFNHLNQRGAHRLSRRLLDIIKKEFKEWKAVQQMLAGMRF